MRRSSFELNDKEKKVLAAFPRKPGTMIAIEDLARKCFASMGIAPDKKGNSWVRNSLRKLFRLGLIKHNGSKSGEYARSEKRPSDVLNDAVESGLCPGPKIGTKGKGGDEDDDDEKPEKTEKKSKKDESGESD